MIIALETGSIEKIDELKNEIIALFDNTISKKAISILVEAQVYNRDYFLGKVPANRSRAVIKKTNATDISDLDLSILKKLASNCRMPLVEIARELGQTVRIVAYRIKQLEKTRIILGYRIAINYDKLGIKFYKAFIHLDNPAKKRVDALIGYLAQNKNIIHQVRVLGNWDLEPEFEVYSDEECDGEIRDIKDKFFDIIKSVDIISIAKEHKFVYF